MIYLLVFISVFINFVINSMIKLKCEQSLAVWKVIFVESTAVTLIFYILSWLATL